MTARDSGPETGPDYDLVSFGETMIRLTAAGRRRLEDAEQLEVTIGGTESNVSVALARLGRRVAWLSALPDNPLGRRITSELRQHGVDTSQVIEQQDARAGVYFMDVGSRPRPTRVIYDRKDSAVARLDPDAVDPAIVTRSRALHLTGITPALSGNCAEICNRLAGAATEAGTPVIFDVNYRFLLWSPPEAREGLAPLLERATLVFCGASDAATIWGLDGTGEEVGRALLDRTSAEMVAVTMGDAGVCAVGRDGSIFRQDSMQVDTVDAVGAGDAFAAGFLDRWLDAPGDIPRALQSGIALASLKMTVPGDLAIVTRQELDETLASLERPGQDIVR